MMLSKVTKIRFFIALLNLLKNKFYNDVQSAYAKGATTEELKALLGRARAKKGMFEGDMEEGELEIGQVSGLIHSITPAADIVAELLEEYRKAKAEICGN